jgi:hypothetical protein
VGRPSRNGAAVADPGAGPAAGGVALPVEVVRRALLRPHPRNYRTHPPDQLEHIVESLRQNYFYRNVVVARDGTILAGHGVVEAAAQLGLDEVPVVRLDLDPEDPKALKVLAGDNGIGHLAEEDDRALTELLREIKEIDADGLLGTGYDELMLANLVMVTRPESEIRDFNAAAHWVGMPEYQEGEKTVKIVVSFRNAEDRAAFLRKLDVEAGPTIKSIWWPPKPKDDLASLHFSG